MNSFSITGNIVDIFQNSIFYGEVKVTNGFIESIHHISPEKEAEPYILTNPYYAYLYAINVIQGRWPEAEELLKTQPKLYESYLENT
jgi:hypothetical protein